MKSCLSSIRWRFLRALWNMHTVSSSHQHMQINNMKCNKLCACLSKATAVLFTLLRQLLRFKLYEHFRWTRELITTNYAPFMLSTAMLSVQCKCKHCNTMARAPNSSFILQWYSRLWACIHCCHWLTHTKYTSLIWKVALQLHTTAVNTACSGAAVDPWLVSR
jgi:hypothetical protein